MNAAIILALKRNEENKKAKIVELRRRKMLRDASDPLGLPDNYFRKFYRLDKDAFTYVLNELELYLKRDSIPNVLKLAATLRFLAEGGYQASIANDCEVALGRSTFSSILSNVLGVMNDKLCCIWIKLEMTDSETTACKQHFYNNFRIPNVIGCIDGTQINIIRPAENPGLYYNRKGNYSINAMIICDHNMRIRFVDATHSGSSHDSLIWSISAARSYLQTHINESWLLGDSGYPLEPILMTPFRTPNENSKESRYNASHRAARNIVERTIGVLKNRFRCLLGARQLHYTPLKSSKIINACCALHNVCKFYNVSDEEIIIENVSEADILEEDPEEIGEVPSSTAYIIRNSIADTF